MQWQFVGQRKNVVKGDVGKKAGNKLFKRFKAKKEGKDALKDEIAEESLQAENITRSSTRWIDDG